MRKKREIVEGAFYHVTSRTNNKIHVFDNRLGRKIMLITLRDAKDKYRFRLVNFCVMPTHIHLLIQPEEGTRLCDIMHWIKIQSAKRWNFIHGSTDHMWGDRYFARAVKDEREYEFVMDYIDQNPVKVGLATVPSDWQASGAFYRANGITDLVDFSPIPPIEAQKALSSIPFLVTNLLPPAQLERTMKYYGAYAKTVEELYETVLQMPTLSDSNIKHSASAYLHYYTGTADYFICEYDRQDSMYGKVCARAFPAETEYRGFCLSSLKSKEHIKLDLSWVPGTAFS